MMLNSDADKMIFVVGNSRSGTTLMGSILGNGPDIFTFEELHFFDYLLAAEPMRAISVQEAETLAARLCAIQASDVLTPKDPNLFSQEAASMVNMIQQGAEEDGAEAVSATPVAASLGTSAGPTTVLDVAAANKRGGALDAGRSQLTSAEVFKVFLQVKADRSGKTIPCEQTPQNVFYIRSLLDLYPNSYVVNMVRDPRDVLLSQKYKWRIRFLGASNIPLFEAFRSWSNYHCAVIAKLWNASVQSAARFEANARVKTVRFEDLVMEPDSVVKSVCDFAGIAFSPQMLDVSQGEGGVSSHKKVSSSVRGIDSGVVSKWKKGGLLAAEIHVCQLINRRNMVRYGYSIAPISLLNKCLSVLLLVFLPFKLSLALLFNLKRAGNLKQAIKQRIFA